MFEIISKQSMRWPRVVLTIAAAIVAGASIYGLGVFDALTHEQGFVNPSAESYAVEKTIEKDFNQAVTAIVMFSSKDKKLAVEDERYRQQVVAILQPLAAKGAKTESFYD